MAAAYETSATSQSDYRKSEDFVFKGPFRDQGMPDFTDKLTEADVVKIQAFIQAPRTRSGRLPGRFHGTGQAVAREFNHKIGLRETIAAALVVEGYF